MKNVSLAVILLFAIAGCNSKAKMARDYNNAIVMKDNGLMPAVTACEEKVKKYYEASQYDSIAIEGKRMEDVIQGNIDEINKMTVPDVKNVDKFKRAYLEYFKFVKGLYTNYTSYGMAATDEKRQEVLKDIQDNEGRKQEVLNDLQKAQREFADANNFKIEKK
jgi:hypothetical protein